MLSNYTSKEQVVRREWKTRSPLSPSEVLLQGNWGTAVLGLAAQLPCLTPGTPELPGQRSMLSALAKGNRAEHKPCSPDPIVLPLLTLTDTQGAGII